MIDTNIMRWDIVDESLWERVQEAEYGEFVFYEHHRYIVQELKNLVRQLKDDLEASRMEVSGYA